MVVDQLTPVYPFTPTPKFLQNNQLQNKLRMYIINLIIVYDVVNIFSMKNYESLRKLRVGVNRYTGVNWSTTTNPFWQDVFKEWIAMSANLRIYNNIDLLTIPLWYNPLISDKPLYRSDWFQNGVIIVAAVVSLNKVISYDELCQKFPLTLTF